VAVRQSIQRISYINIIEMCALDVRDGSGGKVPHLVRSTHTAAVDRIE